MKIVNDLRTWWAQWNLVDRLLFYVAAALLVALALWLFSCSSAKMDAEARSLRWGVEVGKGNSNGSNGSSGYMPNDASWDTTYVGFSLTGDLFPHTPRNEPQEIAYHSQTANDLIQHRLDELEFAKKLVPDPMLAEVLAEIRKRPIALPDPEPKHDDQPPPEQTDEKILGMSPTVFSSVITGIAAAIASGVAIWQRERIGNTARRIAKAMPGKKEH